ncbi:MAG: acyltransferase domain-containing protein [Alphaproteobacteria bacterium]|nr:acyltransferase domain-containing protein [Alphaproteobacteria bacterium]
MRDEPIAIIGASCRFPGADGLDAFWELLVAGRDAVGEVDSRRWSTRFFYHPERAEPGKSYTWAAGLIDGVDQFEPAFFGISPREAVQMDPQQRMLLELVWHAFEDAGIPPSRSRGTDIGVYIGASSTDYSDLNLGDPAAGDSYFMTGNALSILANRISYVFDLRGPSLAIDTACSSSLVALHHACAAIRSRQIASAIVGGINLLLTPYPFLGFCRASMLSRRGRCFAFDERADGYVRGEGGAVVIIKPLADALADRDSIRGLILATGCNSDGRTIGLSLPSAAAQEALLTSVYRDCEVTAADLAFFEMHGTGTPAGDPVEAVAVGHTVGSTRREPLPIGSVKTNIGHLEVASGMAGLLKAVLALEHGVVPPTLHCETPNSNIDFAGLNLRLVRVPEPIAGAKQAIAGVNSFGFGGTNAHAVLASAPQRPRPAGALPMPPLVVSAAAEASLRALGGRWRRLIKGTPNEQLPRLLRVAARGRDHHRHRLATLSGDRSTIATSLDRFLVNEPTSELVTGTAIAKARLAFVFCGNGAQFLGMGQAALRANAAFCHAVEGVDRVLRPELGWSVVERIEGGLDANRVARADIAQPVLFAIQVGIVGVLRAAGIVAEGFLGHSLGEIAAAWAAGALSLSDAARVIAARSRTQQSTAGLGRMAALGLGYEAAGEFLHELGSAAEIAAWNAARSVTVSGPADEIGRLAAAARDRGISCRPLDLDFAFHSRLMDPVRADLVASLTGLSPRQPVARLASTVTGGFVENELLGAEHWWRNIRDPVRFAEATAALIGEGFNIFVEIGPNPILRSYLIEALGSADVEGRVLPSLTRNHSDADPFPAIAAQCWVAGYDWSSSPLFDGEADARGLPLYQWDRQRFWLDKTIEAADLVNPPLDHPLLGFRQRGHYPCWINHLDAQVLPWIADHAIEGVAVFPAAAIIEAALAAAHWRWPDAPVLEAAEVEIRHPLPFERGRMRELRMALTSEDGDWELVSRPRLSSEEMTLHAVGRIAAGHHGLGHRQLPEADASHSVDRDSLYRIAARMGLEYGTRFRTIDCVKILSPDRAVVHLDPTNIGEPLEAYLLHPALLDGALQGLLALLPTARLETDEGSFLPWRFGRVRLEAPFGRVCRRAELLLTRIGARSASADFFLYDEASDLVAAVTDCWFRRIELGRNGSAAERMFRVDLVPAPLVAGGPPEALAEGGIILTRLVAAKASDPERCEQSALLEAMIGAAAHRLWRARVDPEQSFTLQELVDRGRISPTATGLAECLLRSIERLGGVREDHGEWRIEGEADLPEADEIWRLLLADAPDLVGELALIGEALDRLPDLLTAGPARLGPTPPIMIEHFLDASPASAAGSDLLGEALSAIAARWPSDRPLRILEIGAEPKMTRRFLNCLMKSPAAIAYVATNTDAEQCDRLSALTKSFTGASVCRWAPGAGTGLIGDKLFDIVLAANTCARLRLDIAALAGLRDLLVPGGLFMAVEPEPNAVWDIVFGQDAAWWSRDRWGASISPLRSGEEWQAALADAGFRDAAAASLTDGPWPAAAFWGNAPLGREPVAVEPVPSRTIAVIAEDTPLSRALPDRLEADGHCLALAEASDLAAAERHIAGHEDGSAIVIVVAAEPETTSGVATQIASLARIARLAVEHCAHLLIVTSDAHQAIPPGGRQTGLAGAAIGGFARVLANELPRLSLRMLDLAGDESAKSHARQIAQEIAAATPETEIVWTPQGRHVMRLRSGLPPHFGSRGEALTLTAGPTGGLHSLGWVSRATRALGPGEIEIEVHAAGLNFRDVMWTIGLLPEEALIDGFAGATFGLECAGVVRAVGADVTSLTIGDRVIALAPAALGTRVVTSAEAAVPLPAGLGFVSAATLPVAFITVIYALGHLARLAAGEHVLVHAAAGGVGLAAIQYAKHRGAVVIATAGSKTKRTFLRLAGADYVLDSRDLGFADQVREITGGAGVDVVLNSLSGEAMERSLELLCPFGRFLELGKRDFYVNRRLHLRPLRHNVSYFAIDIDQLPLRRPALARSLLAEVLALLRRFSQLPLVGLASSLVLCRSCPSLDTRQGQPHWISDFCTSSLP